MENNLTPLEKQFIKEKASLVFNSENNIYGLFFSWKKTNLFEKHNGELWWCVSLKFNILNPAQRLCRGTSDVVCVDMEFKSVWTEIQIKTTEFHAWSREKKLEKLLKKNRKGFGSFKHNP
jgi:hypothetical protein